MECFLCDNVHLVCASIDSAITKYRKIPLTSILDDFIGNDFEIGIEPDDRICEMCKWTFDELDLLRYKLNNVENILTHKLHRKYKFDSEQELPAIRLDKQTANDFINGKNGRKFQCERCSFSTDFLDCLTPHSLMHHNAVKDGEIINEFACKSCSVILPTEHSFEQHKQLFHSDGNVSKNFTSENYTEFSVDDQIEDNLEHDNQQTFNCTVSTDVD